MSNQKKILLFVGEKYDIYKIPLNFQIEIVPNIETTTLTPDFHYVSDSWDIDFAHEVAIEAMAYESRQMNRKKGKYKNLKKAYAEKAKARKEFLKIYEIGLVVEDKGFQTL